MAVQRGLYGGSPFRSYKSNQEIHEEMALFRGEMTHLRRIISAFHRVHPSSAIQIEASKIASETQQAWSDLWSWPLPPLDSHKGPWECRWRSWPAQFCSRTSSYQQVLSSPRILSQEWMKSSEQVAWIRGREWRWFDGRLLLAGLFHLLPSLLKIVSSVT